MNGSAVLSCYKILHVAIYAAYGNFAGIYPGKLPVFFSTRSSPASLMPLAVPQNSPFGSRTRTLASLFRR